MNANRDEIQLGMDSREDLHQLVFKPEAALQDSGPEVERLRNLAQVVGRESQAVRLLEVESNLAEVQSVRILPKMMEELFLPCGIRAVTDFAAITIVILQAQTRGGQV